MVELNPNINNQINYQWTLKLKGLTKKENKVQLYAIYKRTPQG